MLAPRVLAVLALLALPLARALSGVREGSLRDPDILSYPLLFPEVSEGNVTLLFSNSPEMPRARGLLYRDAVRGRARVVAYHANGLGQGAKLLIFARSLTSAPTALTTLRRGSALTRSPDPVIGQQTLLRFFASAPFAPRELQAGEEALLYSSGPLSPGAVVSVMLDLEVGAPTMLSVVLLGANERHDGATLAALPALAPDANHQRGTFEGANRTLRVQLTDLPARLVLGAGDDPPLRGTDALSGAPQLLLGNYGARYDLVVSGAKGSLLTCSPRGGPYRGVLRLQDGPHSSLILLGRGRALRDPASPTPLWHISGETLRAQFVPANASNLPVAFVFYPVGRRGKPAQIRPK